MSWQTKRFGKLTILKEVAPDIFFCRCDCGNVIEVWRSLLNNNVIRSCEACVSKRHHSNRSGHLRSYMAKSGVRKNKTSGEHNSWSTMNNRCYVKSNPAYESYGGRGITVCERWRRGVRKRGENFKTFLADMGPRPQGMTLDRINPQGHYEPGNCRWATEKVQQENQGRYIWKRNGEEPPPVESAAVMETRVQEENPY